MSDSENIIKFLETVGKLKHISREGWNRTNTPGPESVAGHMYRMAIMTFLLHERKDLNLDRFRCMELALVHDMAEAIVGDITPYCGVEKEEKHRREEVAMKEITDLLGEQQGKYVFDLYKEYECQVTDEAKFVKDLDRFDMILQAFEYEKRDKKPEYLQEFFDSTEGKFQHTMIKDLCDKLSLLRNKYKNSSQE